MKHTFEGLSVEPKEFDKNSGKEVLQYAVGGLLYMPASNLKIADKLVNKQMPNVKSMVLDLEDALGDDLVNYGQRIICKIIEKLSAAVETGVLTMSDIPLIFVRIREANQIRECYKLLGDNIIYITGFNIPKFDKYSCDSFINVFSEVSKEVWEKYGTKLFIMPIIESKNALYRQLRMDNLLYMNDRLRPLAENVLNIRVGGADFCSIFGVRRPIDSIIYEIGPVSSCFNDILNVFGKSYVVSAPVWEYFGTDPNGEWATGLKREIRRDKLMGFVGKTCIHPTQLPIVQESLIVSEEDYADALSILGMNVNTTGVKKSAFGNRMNEVKTHTKWAQKVIGMANVYGVR